MDRIFFDSDDEEEETQKLYEESIGNDGEGEISCQHCTRYVMKDQISTCETCKLHGCDFCFRTCAICSETYCEEHEKLHEHENVNLDKCKSCGNVFDCFGRNRSMDCLNCYTQRCKACSITDTKGNAFCSIMCRYSFLDRTKKIMVY